MLPNGKVYRLNGGIPSGSYLTQLVGSIVNLLVTRTLYAYNGASLKSLRVLGDDSFAVLDDDQFEKVSLGKVCDDAM